MNTNTLQCDIILLSMVRTDIESATVQFESTQNITGKYVTHDQKNTHTITHFAYANTTLNNMITQLSLLTLVMIIR